MKFLKSILLFASAFAVAKAGSGGRVDNAMTFYGCDANECYAQEDPSCPEFEHHSYDLPSHFAALSTHLSHFEDYCGKYAVYMVADGSNYKKLGKATIVDSCSSCSAYHLDLSVEAFTDLASKSAGVVKIIWGIYSKSGERLAGPWHSGVSSVASRLNMGKDDFVNAFDANARKLAASSSHTRDFSASGVSIEKDSSSKKSSTTRRTTTRKTTTYTTRKTTYSSSGSNYNVNKGASPVKTVAKTIPVPTIKTLAPKNAPGNVGGINGGINGAPNGATNGIAGATKALPVNTKTLPANPVQTAANTAPTPAAQAPAPAQQPETKQVEEATPNGNDNGNVGTTVLAVSGGVLGAAGVGLLFLKKKSPSKYEGLKRGLSRRATSLKRKVSRRTPAQQSYV